MVGSHSLVYLNCMKVVCAFIAFIFLPFFGQAMVTNTWKGPATGNWNTAGNWTNGIPAATDSVVIGDGVTAITVNYNVGANIVIGSLNVTHNAILTMTSFQITMNSLGLNGTINGSSALDIIVGNIAPFALSGTGTFALTGGGSLRMKTNIKLQNASDDLKFTSGSLLNLNGFTLTNNGKIEIQDPSDFKPVAASKFTNATASSYLLYTRQANFPSATVTLTSTFAGSTVEYGAAAGSFTMDKQASYSNLIITGSGATKTTGAALTTAITGSLTINSGATFNCANLPVTIGGNWTNNGGTFNAGTSTVTFNGALSQQINGTAAAQTFYNLTVNLTAGQTLSTGGSTVALTTNNLTQTRGNFTAPATLNINTTATSLLTLTAGTLTAGTTINITGNWTNNGGTFTPGAGMVNFVGTAAQAINGTAAAQTFNDVNVNLSAGFSLTGTTATITVNNLTLTTGTFIGPTTLNVNGNWTTSGGAFTQGVKTVKFIGTGSQLVSSGAASQSFYNVVVNLTAGQTLSTGGSIASMTTNNLTITTGNFQAPATLNINATAASTLTLTAGTFIAGATINITGTWANNGGTFTPGTGIVNFVGTAAQAINGTAVSQTFNDVNVNLSAGFTLTGTTATLSFNNLTLSTGTFVPPATLNITGNWTNNGGTFTPGVKTVRFIGTSPEQINGTALAQTFYNVIENMSAGQSLSTGGSTVTLTTNNLTETSGDFTAPAALNINATLGASSLTLTSGTFTAGTNVSITGNWTNNGGIFTPGVNTVNFTGNAGQIINGSAPIQTFYHVVVNKSGGTITVAGSTATLNADTWTETKGNFTAPATFNLTGTSTADLVLTLGTFTAGANVTISGDWTNNGGTFTPGTNTVSFVGTAAQQINGTAIAQTFNNVVVNLSAGMALSVGGSTATLTTNNLTVTSGIFTAPATLNINHTVTATVNINGGTFIAGATINVVGDWTHSSGGFTPGVNTVNFTGTATQTITDASIETFYIFNSNTTGPIVLDPATSVVVTNKLTMTKGNFSLPSGQSLTLGNNSGATLTRVAGNFYGPGAFIRYIPGSTAISSGAAPLYGLFPVGTSASYRPVTINSTVNPTVGGYCSVSHNDPGTFTELGVTGVADGAGVTIQRFYDATSTISTTGIVGGTFNLGVAMTGLSAIGPVTNLYLEADVANLPVAKGTTAATTGTATSPVGNRTGLTLANLSFSFVIATKNESGAGTPMEGAIYSIVAAGNWNTGTTWSYLAAGPTCNCTPAASDSVVIQSGNTVTLNISKPIRSLYISNGGTLTASGTFAVTIGTLGTDGGLTISGSGKFNGTSTVPQVMNGWYIDGTAVGATSGIYSVSQDLLIGYNAKNWATTNLNFTGAGNLNMGGAQFTNNGTITIGASSNLKNGTFINAATGNLKDNANAGFPVTATLDASAIGNNVFFGATAAGTYALPTLNSFCNLTIGASGSALAVTYPLKDVSNPLAISGNLIINSSTTLDANANSVDLTVAGNWTNNAGTFTPGTRNVTFNGTTAQSITKASGETFYGLSFSGAGVKTLGGAVTATSDLTIGAGSTLDVSASNYALTVGGNWVDNGTFVPETGTVTLNKVGAQTITDAGTETFNNLSLQGGFTKTLASPVVLNAGLTIASGTTLDDGAGNNAISIAGNWSNSGTFLCRAGTVTFNGASAQSITNTSGETFDFLVLSGAGGTTLGGPVSTNADLNISGGSSLDVTTSNYPVNIGGNLTNDGTFTCQAGTVTFNGSSAQTIGGSTLTNFNNITLNNAAGVSILGAENLIGTLTLTAGTFNTTGQIFTLISTAANTANIAAIPSSGSGFSGDIVMQRYVQPGATGWYFLGAPITAAAGLTLSNWDPYFFMSGFPGSNLPGYSFNSEYTYDETVAGGWSNGYNAATDISNPIVPGQGWQCYVGPVPLTLSVTGPPVTGNFSFPVTYTPSAGGAANDGWNLLSNPYPSTIDWNAGGGAWTKSNVSGAIEIWNPATSTYASWVAGVSTNGGSNFLSSSQAFWVQTDGASPILNVTESAKTSTDAVFFRTRPSNNENTLKLKISGNGYYDEAAIHFTDSATIHYDFAYDAKKLYVYNMPVPSIASLADSFDLAINSMPGLTAAKVIPLRTLIGTGTSGTYTISRDSILTLSLSTCLILEDKLTGIQTDLRVTPSYSFTIMDTTQAPRFFLHIGAPIGKQTVATLCPGGANGFAVAQGVGGASCSYTWKNAADSVIQINANVSGNDTLHNLAAGIYHVTITGNAGSCSTLADTFAVTSPSSTVAFETTTNTSCSASSDGAINISAVLGGRVPYSYSWSNGSSVASLAGVATGTYTLTITDGNACKQSTVYTVANGSLLHGSFAQSADTVYLDAGATVNFSDYSVGFSGFKWNFGDASPADSLTLNPAHQYAGQGIYRVSLIVLDGTCADTLTHTVVVLLQSPSGIHPIQKPNQSVEIFSANGTCFVDFHLSEETQVVISVYDMLGAKEAADVVTTVYRNQVPLDLGNKPSGIYLISITINGNQINRKIVR